MNTEIIIKSRSDEKIDFSCEGTPSSIMDALLSSLIQFAKSHDMDKKGFKELLNILYDMYDNNVQRKIKYDNT